ncbi:hypothetical protein H4219_001332 [Mycoemilia scoparia]|uniref:NADH-cytochrome b5 reductase n=1 Tax=Mycoemilia scoparia TaxID=417184 RepID=A0A9W8A8D0_9FUNG|nr:hypothetical protein H4219_001332 [Mycoemilia scoparia]
MFNTLRTGSLTKLARSFSSQAPAPGKGSNSTLFAALATAAVLGGGYWYYTTKAGGEVSIGEKGASGSKAGRELRTALDPSKFTSFKLKEVQPITGDTSLFRFELDADQKLGMTVTSCLLTKAPPQKEGGKAVIRPYTPTSEEDTAGYFDLIIKKYNNGVMSSYIHSLKPGDTLDIKGPIGKLPYSPNLKKEIGLICGGSGITPMLQIIRAILKNPEDKTKVTLLFANRTENDIILQGELDALAAKNPERFKVHYIVDKAKSKDWKGDVGFVTSDIVKKYMPDSANGDNVLVGVCGPPGMMDLVSGSKAPDYTQGTLSGILKDLGYTEKNVFKF